jgi:hypothetical protein
LNLSPVAGFGLIRGGCGITRDIRDAASHSGIMLRMGGSRKPTNLCGENRRPHNAHSIRRMG